MDTRPGRKPPRIFLVAKMFPPRYAAAALAILVLATLFAGCTQSPGTKVSTAGDPLMSVELTDVRTGQVFTLGNISDRPVLVQTFTITCPVCMRQQEEITQLNASGTVPFVMVGLDIDPNGDSESLRSYTERQGYYGLYARSPPQLTRILVDRFGTSVLSPSQAPLILFCRGGNAFMFPPGIKSADDLEKALSGC